MTDTKPMTDDAFILYAVKDNKAAAALVADIIRIGKLWDDLHDRDKDYTDRDLYEAFWSALVSIPSNGFYRENFDTIQPLVQSAIVSWSLSEVMESRPGISREIAHVIRYGAAEIVVMAAGICGGRNWAIEVGPEIWTRIMREDFAAFNTEQEKAK